MHHKFSINAACVNQFGISRVLDIHSITQFYSTQFLITVWSSTTYNTYNDFLGQVVLHDLPRLKNAVKFNE